MSAVRRRVAYPMLEQAIRRKLGKEWLSAREITERVGYSTTQTVRGALLSMAQRGACERKTLPADHQFATVNLYRKPTA